MRIAGSTRFVILSIVNEHNLSFAVYNRNCNVYRIRQLGLYLEERNTSQLHQYLFLCIGYLCSTAVNIKFLCMYSLFKALHGKAPRYLEEPITIYQPTRALRSEKQSLLKSPSDAQTRTYSDRRFDTAAATLWNNLPNSLRNIQSVDLKTHLFRQAYRDYL